MYCKKQKVGKSQNHRRDTQEGWQHPVEWHQCFCRKALRKLEPGEWREAWKDRAFGGWRKDESQEVGFEYEINMILKKVAKMLATFFSIFRFAISVEIRRN